MRVIQSKKCPCCSKSLYTEQLSNDLFAYCNHCYEFVGIIRDEYSCCDNPNLHLVKHENRDGRYQLREQCNSCHYIYGQSLKQTEVFMSKTPESNVDMEYQTRTLRRKEAEDFLLKFRKEFNDNTKLRVELLKSDTSYSEYTEYLESDEWRSKRKLVLKRDNYTCQSCLNAKAIQVHHITYKHLKNEPLFELVSVCIPCHESITNMDHFEEYAQIANKLYENLLS